MKRLILILLMLLGALAARGQDLSLTLDDCLRGAMAADADLKGASLDVLAAKAQRQEALSLYFPTVSIQGMAFKAFDPLLELGIRDILREGEGAQRFYDAANFVASITGNNILDWRYTALSSGYGAAALAVQPLFAGGRIVNGNRLAVLGVEAARMKAAMTSREKGDAVAEKYWRVVSLEEKARALDAAIKAVSALSSDASAAVEAGLVTATEAMQAQIKLRELRSKQVRLHSGVRLAKMDLLEASGVPYSPYETMATEGFPFIDRIALADTLGVLLGPEHYFIPEEEVAAGLDETRLLDLQVRAKRLEKKMVIGEALPQVGVGVSYGYGDFGVGKARWNGGVFASVKIPLSDWGRTARKAQRYEYEIQKAENQQESLLSQLLLRTRKLWLDVTAAWEEVLVQEDAVAYAEATLKTVEGNHAAGLTTLSDVLQGQMNLSLAQSDLADARAAYRTALRAYRAQAE